jgi:hypothetical protein
MEPQLHSDQQDLEGGSLRHRMSPRQAVVFVVRMAAKLVNECGHLFAIYVAFIALRTPAPDGVQLLSLVVAMTLLMPLLLFVSSPFGFWLGLWGLERRFPGKSRSEVAVLGATILFCVHGTIATGALALVRWVQG